MLYLADPNDFALWINALAAGLISSFWALLIIVLLAGVIIRASRWATKSKKKTRRAKKA